MTTTAISRDRGVLANGIRHLVCERPGAHVTTVSVWILSGSRHETVPGVAHLFEHVVMQAVPPGRRLRVIDEIESMGGEGNAVTHRDSVVLHARVPTPDAQTALDLLMAAATASTFDAELVEAERRVVVEELRLAAADPTDIVHDVFFATAFGDDPMGRPVGGTPADVARITMADLTAWAGTQICGERVGVVVSGGLPAEQVADAVAAGPLGALPRTTQASESSRPSNGDSASSFADVWEAPGGPPLLRAGRSDLALTSDTGAVLLGGPGFSLADPLFVAAEIVIELLARSNAAVLTEEIRSKRGLSYDVSGYVTGYRDIGVWRIPISTAPQHCDEVVRLATELLYDAVRRGWTEAEVAAARRRVAGLLRLDIESSLEEVFLAGQYALVGGLADWSVSTQLDRLAAVDASAVHTAAELMMDRLVVATAGRAGD